jgi:hypothetical protein
MGITPGEVTRIVESIKGHVRYRFYHQGQEHGKRAA